MATFSQEILAIIFSGLPVKSLLRFRCLSKLMRSIIENPKFTKLHLDRSVLIESDLCLAIDDHKSGGTMHYVDLDMDDNYLVQLEKTLTFEIKRMDMRLLGTCNGPVALYRGSLGMLLQNPSTNRQQLVGNFWDSVITYPYEFDDPTLDGFGYDAEHDDYKLVSIRQCSLDRTAKTAVYSSRARASRRLPDCPYVYTATAHILRGIYVAGSVHWIVYKVNHDNGDDLEDDEDNFEEEEEHLEEMIIALDLTTETFHVVPLPEIECHPSTLGALGDCLAIGFCNSATLDFEIWMMKEYRVQASWTKLVYIPRVEQEVFGVTWAISPLYLTRNGDRVLLEINGSFLFWYNIVLKRIEYFGHYILKR